MIAAVSLLTSAVADEPLTAVIPAAPSVVAGTFNLGAARRPDGATLIVDQRSLLLNGVRWLPAMGEFHYTRYPEAEWRDELLRMKAGGLDVVATYVFWIHHEEIEGGWDWSGQRSLREFVRLAGELGLTVVVRCGPWCHGEVRNGGLPDWTLNRDDWQARSQDAGFLEHVRTLYGQIAQQLRGQLWKDGGPVIGIQVDNEYGGPAEYLLALKAIAREVGLDVPLYTRTGWPRLRTPMPFGEILPLYGGYAEGFWDREVTSMPGRYWTAFRFSTQRLDENIANEQLGRREASDESGVDRYPYLTCEMGGGMMSSYHRRIRIEPADVETPVLIKLGSGSTLPGYYMYHGGTNPEGRRTTLNEAQATASTNWNDLPVKNYDFQAPLGAAGQIWPSYHLLRRLHLFLHDFGEGLAAMPPVLPTVIPQGADDTTTLRWIVRSDGDAGYIFVSNYERGRTLPAHAGTQFRLQLPDGAITIPATPVTIPSDARFIWPFNLDLGHGVRLAWATAQPLCHVDEGNTRTVFFAQTSGIEPQFSIGGEDDVQTAAPANNWQLRVPGDNGAIVRIVALNEADSRMLWKGHWRGRDRVFLTGAGLTIDGAALRLTSENPDDLEVGVFPGTAPARGGQALFQQMQPVAKTRPTSGSVSIVQVREAGPLREIKLGAAGTPVAEQPSDADFAHAALWRITLPRNLDFATDPILRIHYVGDVARVLLNGRLLTDDFFNGRELDLGLRRYTPEIREGDLRIAILPLQRDAVTGDDRMIYLAGDAMPDFGAAAGVARLEKVELIPRYTVEITTE